MDFFHNTYIIILNFMQNLTISATTSFLCFLAMAVLVLCICIGIISLLCSKEARTAKKLIKINNLLIKNQTRQDPNFIAVLDKILKRGNDRLKLAYNSFLANKKASIQGVFMDSRLQRGYSKNINFVKHIGNFLAIILTVLLIGAYSTSIIAPFEHNLFRILTFPLIIFILTSIYNVFYALIRKHYENIIIDYSAVLKDNILPYVHNGHSEIVNLKNSFWDGYDISEEEYVENESSLKLKSATETNTNYAQEVAKLAKEKEALEISLAKEREERFNSVNKIEDDIKLTKTEMSDVKSQISKTDNTKIKETLKEQEQSQQKLVSALEKLKATEQSKHDEADAKLQQELNKIESMLGSKKTTQTSMIKKDLEEVETETKKIVSPAANRPKKNINDALNSLLTTMNKYKSEKPDNEDDKK